MLSELLLHPSALRHSIPIRGASGWKARLISLLAYAFGIVFIGVICLLALGLFLAFIHGDYHL
jgi:hypothetical protein